MPALHQLRLTTKDGGQVALCGLRWPLWTAVPSDVTCCRCRALAARRRAK